MARIRTIKPSFFKNEYLADLPASVRLLFIGLWTLSDRDGRLEDRPKRIKADLFPYENIDLDGMLDELRDAGFILRYAKNGVSVIQIVNFRKHQNIGGKEAETPSELPDLHEANELGSDGEVTGRSEAIGK